MFTVYEPRPVKFLGLEELEEYQLKLYSITFGNVPFERERFRAGISLATKVLPEPAVSEVRPGAGFMILHQGRTGDYLILCWWDRENELPTRVYFGEAGVWRAAQASESFCVWDLQVIWWEREAYVRTMLSAGENRLHAYLHSEIPASGNVTPT